MPVYDVGISFLTSQGLWLCEVRALVSCANDLHT